MIIKYSDKFIEKNEFIFDHVQNKSAQKFLTYLIDSKYRKAVELKEWIKDQIILPTAKVKEFADSIKNRPNFDEMMVAIMDHVAQRVKYVSDSVKWVMTEKWQTADETVKDISGDCEDGVILQYVLARLKGVPANRLLLFCGDALSPSSNKLVGHCWLGYRPTNYPLNFAFLDWCWHYNSNLIQDRNLFTVSGRDIFEEKKSKFGYSYADSSYKATWFCFNENRSYVDLWRK